MREVGTVVSEGLNLRTFGHVGARALTELEKGTELDILGRYQKSEDEGMWLKVRVTKWMRDEPPADQDGKPIEEGWVKERTRRDGVLVDVRKIPLAPPVEPEPGRDEPTPHARAIPRWLVVLMVVGAVLIGATIYAMKARGVYLVP